ncbi:hypothetical protein PoB_004006100 [Plakobranchus ocellatus]|uniref:Uncharacterized protein n=1 Tax=Plakobranchus ocellatus TaxID=259542 RepID=A0AAV4AQX9_9GAST|nr:hypothetical protein PoB_004006100 [Plakobranchus ocellatus]
MREHDHSYSAGRGKGLCAVIPSIIVVISVVIAVVAGTKVMGHGHWMCLGTTGFSCAFVESPGVVLNVLRVARDRWSGHTSSRCSLRP